MDIDKIRRETPACQKIIHFNNAGAALSPEVVTESVIQHLKLEQQIGGYEAAEKKQNVLEAFYSQAAQLINSKPSEIAYVENATVAWRSALHSIPFKSGDEIITGYSEYVSNYLAMLHLAKKMSLSIKVIPDDENGLINLQALRDGISEKTRLIAVTHVPTSNGLISPAIEVGKIAKEHQVHYLLDTCQSLGQVPVNVQEVNCDFLCATGRKYLRGPRGTGFLYVRSEVLEQLSPVFVDYHSAHWLGKNKYEFREDARRFENWETNFAAKIGLSEAIGYCNALGIENISRRVVALADQLRSEVSSLDKVKVLDRGLKKSGIVTFTVHEQSPDDLCSKLKEKSINISVSRNKHSLNGLDLLGLESVARASLHYYNTEKEIGIFVEELDQILKQRL